MMENSWITHFLSANRFTLKGMLIALLTLVMLIPTALIMNLVDERAERQQAVAEEVAAKWAGRQTIAGPMLVIPYRENLQLDDGKTRAVKKYAYFLPNRLQINGVLLPELRHRSIYDIVVYRADLQIEGMFSDLQPEALQLTKDQLQLDAAFVCIGLDDFRGIEDQLNLVWNGNNYMFNAGLPDDRILKNGLITPVSLNEKDLTGTHSFSLHVKLRGSENLSFIPVGKTTSVSVSSTWANPSFDGSFLPVTTPEIDERGFNAHWKVQDINRSYPQRWKDADYRLAESRLGLTLLQPVDAYSKTMRSVKYAVLFIALTFGLYLFAEVLQKKNVHPVQYVLVGLALCIFYTLLLSMSEYIGFNLAYLIAAIATISLITLYTKAVMRAWKLAMVFCGILITLYTSIFILLQLQDGALLFGSIGLFVVLAAVMYFSRKIKWYGQAA